MLTATEQAEFTLLNLAAYDLVRVEAQKKGQHPACWLVMSEEAKAQARVDIIKWLNDNTHPLIPFTEETAEKILRKMHLEDNLARWRQAEEEYAKMREVGNPRAFFAN